MQDDETSLPLPAQAIPVPKSISPQAQAFLAGAAKRIRASASAPPARDQSQAAEAALQMLRPRAAGFRGGEETIALPHGAKLYRITAPRRAATLPRR